jgi:hypothetical protein
LWQVWLKLAKWFLEKKILKWPHPIFTFFTFLRLSPLWREPDPLLNKLKFPSPKDSLYQVWLNLASWFWKRRFFKMFSVVLHICYYLPLERGYPLPLNKPK